MHGRRVLLGVSGGIAAYKAVLLARLLVTQGATVDVVLTRGAAHFVGAATFEGITGRPVRSEVWTDVDTETHVALARAADLVAIYPATAHTLAKAAHGLADDLLTTSLLATTAPVVVAPAMHSEMWQHAATRANVELLAKRGVAVVGPAAGQLMGGDVGEGRVVEPEDFLAALRDRLADDRTLAGRTVVVTAAGTREAIDPVRFIGNRATGRMGFAVARVAAARGARVHLVAGPTHLATPAGVQRHDVVSAADMAAAVTALRDEADVVVKAAAVADYRPATVAEHKIKKQRDDATDAPSVELVRTTDILAELGAWREQRGGGLPVLVGFAAETQDVLANGREKLARKRLDLLVANDVSARDAGFGTETNRVHLVHADGRVDDVPLTTKDEVAAVLLDAVAELLSGARVE